LKEDIEAFRFFSAVFFQDPQNHTPGTVMSIIAQLFWGMGGQLLSGITAVIIATITTKLLPNGLRSRKWPTVAGRLCGSLWTGAPIAGHLRP